MIKSLAGGGAERLVVDSLTHADKSKFDYHVAYLLAEGAVHVPAITGGGVPVTCLREFSSGPWPLRLRRLVRDRQIALVHAHSPLVAVAARLVAGVPVVYTEHAVWPNYHPLTRVGNSATFGRNAYAFAVSDEVRSSISSSARGTPVETLRYGVDLGVVEKWRRDPVDVRREFRLPPDSLTVATVANLRPAKGHETLLRGIRQVIGAVPAARFVVVGEGPLKGRLIDQAAELGIEDVVRFAGFREDAGRIVAGADLFVLPSVFDGLSIALIEAMALGTPVAITGVGGNPEVVDDGQHGLVVPPSDPDALARAMIRLLRDAGLRASLGEAAATRAKQLDIRSAVRRHESVYEALLAGRSPQTSA
jgi:glycosyltransferase involved in cell wall biosynthesis